MRTLNQADRLELLTAAARLIESRQPAHIATLRYRITLSPGDTALFLVRFDFPGVVSVLAHDTGERLVRSMPGHPSKPDMSFDPHARGLAP